MELRKLAVGSAVVGAVVLGGIGVASADVGVKAEACTPDRVCIYKNNNFVTKMLTKAPMSGLENVASLYDDEMSSWRNLTNVDAKWYFGQNARGTCVTMRAGTSDNDINSLDDNQLSSWDARGRC